MSLLTRHYRANEVRHDPVGRPVTAADDVAAARIRDQHAIATLRQRCAIGGGDQLGAGLGGAVGILTTKRILFAIAPHPILIAIDLVGGYAHELP